MEVSQGWIAAKDCKQHRVELQLQSLPLRLVHCVAQRERRPILVSLYERQVGRRRTSGVDDETPAGVELDLVLIDMFR